MNKFLLLSKLWKAQMETGPIFYLPTSCTEKKNMLPSKDMLFLCSETGKAMIKKWGLTSDGFPWKSQPNVPPRYPSICEVSAHSLVIPNGAFIKNQTKN